MPKSLEDLTVDELRQFAASAQSSHALLTKLASDPKTRESIQRAIKTLSPTTSIPEIDATDRVMAAVATEREERLKLERSIQERDIRERLERQRAQIKEKYSLTDADVLAVEALMTDKDNPIPTYDAAARVHLASRQSATPTPATYSPPTYSMPEKDIWSKGIGNKMALDKIALEQAAQAWNEIASGKAVALG